MLDALRQACNGLSGGRHVLLGSLGIAFIRVHLSQRQQRFGVCGGQLERAGERLASGARLVEQKVQHSHGDVPLGAASVEGEALLCCLARAFMVAPSGESARQPEMSGVAVGGL